MKIFNRLLIFVLALGVVSCEDYLDINTDPNNPTEVPNELVIPAAQASVAITLAGDLANLGGFMAQYWTQAPAAQQYQGIDTYDITTDTYDNIWQEFYAGGLNDFEYIRTQSAENGEWANYLLATVMRAYIYQVLVDLYDNVPYSEALKGTEVLTPVFDDGEQVYGSVIAEIDNALSRDFTNLEVSSTDLLLDGDIDKWIKFANSLKLKMYLRQAYTSNDVSSAVIDLINEDNFLEEDVEYTAFQSGQNKQNPWYDTNVDRLGGINHVATHTIITYLKQMDDPRLETIYLEATNGGYEGNYPGSARDGNDRFDDTDPDNYSFINIPDTHPSYLMTYAEVNFLKAEAYVRYFSDNASAKLYFEEGVKESLMLHGLETEINDFVGDGKSVSWTNLTGDVEADIEQIMMQKWVANAKYNPIEGWFDFRRTDYPSVSDLVGSDENYVPGQILVPTENNIGVINGFVNRLWYPDVEVTRNSNTPGQPSNLTAKVWWDQK